MDGVDYGLIMRSACAGSDPDEIAEDVAEMVDCLPSRFWTTQAAILKFFLEGDTPHLLAWRDWVEPAEIERDAGGFERLGVLEDLDVRPAVVARAPCRAAAILFIEPTRALVAVDVNTGKDTSLAAGIKANLGLCQGIATCSYACADLAGKLSSILRQCPKKTAVPLKAHYVLRFKTDSDRNYSARLDRNLGHFELQRKRGRIPLVETLPEEIT